MMATPENSKSSGTSSHSDEVRSGGLSNASRRLLEGVSRRMQSSRGPDDSPASLNLNNASRDSSPTQPPGSPVDDGKQSRMMKPPQLLPSNQLSVQSRRQANSQNEPWRIGFGRLMVAMSVAHNRVYSLLEIQLWASALSDHDLEDLNAGFAEFLKTPESFPTPGKVEKYVQKCRRNRLGIVVR
jgi:hypothetical protein